MKASLLILLSSFSILALSIKLDQDLSSRIVKGKEASLCQFPWMAYLTLYKTFEGLSYTLTCGGVLISSKWVLSVAQCLDGALSGTVALGILKLNETDVGITVDIESAMIHENYSEYMLINDIALIKLKNEIELAENIQVIGLSDEYIQDDVDVTVSGWGYIDDYFLNDTTNILLYTELKTLSNSDCAAVYGDSIVEQQLCCVGNDIEGTCNGDSGGPLVTGSGSGAKLVGLVSFGSSRGCMTKDPSGFTRISKYHEWILSNIQGS